MEFPGNTNKNKNDPPDKKVVKVVSGEVVQKQKSFGQKFKDVFFNGEFKPALRYIAGEVLLPAVRNMIVDATTTGIERMIYGDSAANRPRSNGPRISYNMPVNRHYSQRGFLPDQPARGGKRMAINDIILSSRDEANLVLERMIDIIDQYDFASVADLHDLVGLPTTYVDNKWGWTNLSFVEIRQVREGFLLDLPRAEAI